MTKAQIWVDLVRNESGFLSNFPTMNIYQMSLDMGNMIDKLEFFRR